MLKIIYFLIICIISLNYCFNEEFISKKVFDHKINQMKSHFERLFDQMSNDLIKFKEQTWNDCRDDWFTYSDRKCYKVLDIKGSIDEAKGNCSEIDSSLITIESEEEQLFLANILENYNYNNISDNAWIGLEMSENSYKWLDGNNVNYENWDENSDKKEKCVEMSLGKASLGKWRDESCSKNYLIICQKKQNSKTVFTEELKNLTKVIERQETELKKHQVIIVEQQNQIKTQENEMKNQKSYFTQQMNSLIPISFLYIQLHGQNSPKELWPNFNWVDVTSNYAGLFFRALGGNSSSFGYIQDYNTQRLVRVESNYKINTGGVPGQISTKPNGWSPLVWTGYMPAQGTAGGNQYLKFEISGGEIRPRNSAIKIWKRI